MGSIRGVAQLKGVKRQLDVIFVDSTGRVCSQKTEQMEFMKVILKA